MAEKLTPRKKRRSIWLTVFLLVAAILCCLAVFKLSENHQFKEVLPGVYNNDKIRVASFEQNSQSRDDNIDQFKLALNQWEELTGKRIWAYDQIEPDFSRVTAFYQDHP